MKEHKKHKKTKTKFPQLYLLSACTCLFINLGVGSLQYVMGFSDVVYTLMFVLGSVLASFTLVVFWVLDVRKNPEKYQKLKKI